MSSTYFLPHGLPSDDDTTNYGSNYDNNYAYDPTVTINPTDTTAAATATTGPKTPTPNISLAASHLSPYSSPNIRTTSTSPPASSVSHTPAESVASLSVQHSVTDYQEQINLLYDPDPFVGADFSDTGLASPTFLQENELMSSIGSKTPVVQNTYPISPETTPQLGATSPPSHSTLNNTINPAVIAPKDLLTKQTSFPFPHSADQLTPEASGGSGHSSDDGMAHGTAGIPVSPHVALWDENNVARPVHVVDVVDVVDQIDDDEDGPITPRDPAAEMRFNLVDNAVDTTSSAPPATTHAAPAPTQNLHRRGLGPDERPTDYVQSVNELEAQCRLRERNDSVSQWLTKSDGGDPGRQPVRIQTDPTSMDNIPERPLHHGQDTENQLKEGQTYLVTGSGAQMTEEDIRIIKENRGWADAPVLPGITKPTLKTERTQPATSQEAINKMQRMNDDVGSTISRSATWGTRPRSIAGMPGKEPSDMEKLSGAGGIFQRLSITTRRPAELLKTMRRPSVSNILKRSKTDETEKALEDESTGAPNTLGVPRTSSWTQKNQVPSINTAMIAIGAAGAAVASTHAGHARTGSVSATSITSPKSPIAGALGQRLGRMRPRSKSELSVTPASQSHIATMWRREGGVPIAQLPHGDEEDGDVTQESKHSSVAATPAPASALSQPGLVDDDDDDDDEDFEASQLPVDDEAMVDIEPNYEGFKKQVVRVNPSLEMDTENNHLVERIAYQQVMRYKNLLGNRVKHISSVASGRCSCGSHCIDLGGSAHFPDSKGGARGTDPLSAAVGGSDDDMEPQEGAINQESFPPDIPMPPTKRLPAKFECQICFGAKTFKKPSDWTKHVHEDVQPFTCTWKSCRDHTKMFKRKADWVRHENEGHRHLEWWECNVDDCQHKCYRRDNFLQHLVREHKYPEPLHKTKAAIKKHGKHDTTWQMVDNCHYDTTDRPQDEPCKFCGKEFPTWKKLTVHLAKHMEQISLPILGLVRSKELEADTIISPIQDPPQRPFQPGPPLPPQQDVHGHHLQQFPGMAPLQHLNISPGFQQPNYATVTPPDYRQQQFYNDFSGMNAPVTQAPQPDMAFSQQQMAAGTRTRALSQGMSPLPVSNGAFTTVGASFPSVPADGFNPTTAALEPFPSLVGTTMGIQALNTTAPVMEAHVMNGGVGGQGVSAQGLGVGVGGLGLHSPPTGAHFKFEYDPQADEMQTGYNGSHSHPGSVHGGVSPYMHSPNQGTGSFYGQ